MFAFYTSLSKRTKYSKLCVFLTDLESDTQWGRDHRNFIEAFVYSEFDMFMITSLNQYFKRETNITRKPKSMDGSRNRSCILSFLSKQVRRDRNTNKDLPAMINNNEMQHHNYSAYQNKSCCLCLMHIQFGMSSRNLPGSCCTHADNHGDLTNIHRDLESNKTTISNS